MEPFWEPFDDRGGSRADHGLHNRLPTGNSGPRRGQCRPKRNLYGGPGVPKGPEKEAKSDPKEEQPNHHETCAGVVGLPLEQLSGSPIWDIDH